jgi:hypothetical protein
MCKINLSEEQCSQVRNILTLQGKYRYYNYNSVESLEWVSNQQITAKFDPEPEIIFVPCFKIRGSEKILNESMSQYGTTYIYSSEHVYEPLFEWFKPHFRDCKLQELGL